MAVHTSGPWKRSGGGGVVACMESEILSSGRRTSRRVACAKGTSIQEVEANATLITASPDMLDVLRKTLAFLNREDDCDDMAEIMQAIEDVIQQATEG